MSILLYIYTKYGCSCIISSPTISSSNHNNCHYSRSSKWWFIISINRGGIRNLTSKIFQQLTFKSECCVFLLNNLFHVLQSTSDTCNFLLKVLSTRFPIISFWNNLLLCLCVASSRVHSHLLRNHCSHQFIIYIFLF